MSDASALRLQRLGEPTPDALALLEEYYNAMQVTLRDGPEALQVMLRDPRSGLWVAYMDDSPAGCVLLRAGVPQADAGECKRLFVRPAWRGRGIADSLMQTLEQAAAAAGLGWVSLDTTEQFRASVALYHRRGYQPCERYNQNPQATLFFRKRLCVGES